MGGFMQTIQLRPVEPDPEITDRISKDLQNASDKQIHSFKLIRSKRDVHVYSCLYGEVPAVVKYFENEEDRREILNYRILIRSGIPTIRILAFGGSALVMEDLSQSEKWRLGVPEDLSDTDTAQCLAQWYFAFHEKGAAVSELNTLYFEYDGITKKSLEMLCARFPEASGIFMFILSRFDKLRNLIYEPSFTLTYNDFYWTNFAVRKDKQAAMMFDYNLLGKGYRFSDFRNVRSLAETAYQAFLDEYERLYVKKHGHTRHEEERLEVKIDEVAAPLFSLIVASRQEQFPEWAEYAKEEALDGTLADKAKRLLS